MTVTERYVRTLMVYIGGTVTFPKVVLSHCSKVAWEVICRPFLVILTPQAHRYGWIRYPIFVLSLVAIVSNHLSVHGRHMTCL